MQFSSPDNSNPKRREKGVTKFSLFQKKSYDFSQKHFRVFDNKQGRTFDLAPITILTGCNSSGKSSVVKALMLLKDFFQELSTK